MSEIDDLFERIDDDPSDATLRLDIADFLLKNIEEKKYSLGCWEKGYFSQSVDELENNINHKLQPNRHWLKLCLTYLTKALVPEEERSDEYTNEDEQTNSVTYEMLVDRLNTLKKI